MKWNFFYLCLFSIVFNIVPNLHAASYKKNASSYEWRQYGKWVEIEADWLYWKPCITDMDVAAIVENNRVKYKNLCSDWDNGIKISLFLPDVFHGFNISSSYYRVHNTSNISQHPKNWDENNGVVSPMLFPQENLIAVWQKGKESSDLLYNEWDMVVLYDLPCGKCQRFSPYLGLGGLYIEHEIEGKFSSPGNHAKVEWDLTLSAIGLRAGSQYQYDFNCGWTWVANVNVSLLEGNDTVTNIQKFHINSGVTTDNLNDDPCSHPVYGYHLGCGLLYDRCLCGFEYKLHLGYELVSWYNLPNHRVFFGNDISVGNVNSSSPRSRVLSFHGLTAGCSMVF